MASMNETLVRSKDVTISVLDYIVLAVVLVFSLGIGVFYSCKQKTSEEYLHGGRQMALIPVSISLVVSFISAITMQGLTAEMYVYGIDLLCDILGVWGVFVVLVSFVPVFYELKPTTVFDYLQLRFQSNIPNILGSVVASMGLIVYAGAVTYGPASALESFLNTPTTYNIIVMSVVCTVYTTIGGIKAVVWTDVLQAVIMITGLIVVLIISLARIGLGTVMEELSRTGRTHLSLNPSLTQRYNLWMGFFGSGIHTFCVFINQIAMVRYTGLATIRQARISVGVAGVSFCLIMALAMCTGAVIFAHYSLLGCGPLESGAIYTPNQIAPYYVMTEINYPGMPGLFIAAILASSLSTISSVQNGLSAIVWKHFISPFVPNIHEFRKTLLLKFLALALGVMITVMAFVLMTMTGTLVEMTASIASVLVSPMSGIFILAGFCPWVGIHAGLIGWFCSSSFCMWMSLGKLIYGPVWGKPDPISENCQAMYAANTSEYLLTSPTSAYQWTSTVIFDENEPQSTFALYSISHYFYYAIGVTLTVVIALILSIIPAFRQKKPFDAALVVPFMRRFVKIYEWPHDQKDVKYPGNIEPLMGMKTGEKSTHNVL